MAVKLYLETMLGPKLPLVFARFHSTTQEERKSRAEKNLPETTGTGVNEVPNNSNEAMARSEFRKFIMATQLGVAQSDGHSVVRVSDATTMETQFLTAAGFRLDPTKPDEEVSIPQAAFCRIASMIMVRLCMSRVEAVPFVVKEWGLNIKTPNFPTDQLQAFQIQCRQYARDNVLPLMRNYVRKVQSEQANAGMVIFIIFYLILNYHPLGSLLGPLN